MNKNEKITKFKVSSYSLGPKELMFAKCYNTINFMFPVSTPFYTDTSLILVLCKALENYVSPVYVIIIL